MKKNFARLQGHLPDGDIPGQTRVLFRFLVKIIKLAYLHLKSLCQRADYRK